MRNRNNVLLYIYLFIFLSAIFLLFSNGRYGGDGLEDYLTAESIALDRDLSIYDRPFAVSQMRYSLRGELDEQGRYYSSHGIGMPIILLPLYILGHLVSKIFNALPHDYITQFFVSLANPLIIALTAVVLFYLLLQLHLNLKTCLLTVFVYAFCTMSLIYTRSGFAEPAVGLLFLLSVFMIFRFEETHWYRYFICACVFLGYALLIKKNSLLCLPVLFGYCVLKSATLKSFKEDIKLWLCFISVFLSLALLYLFTRTMTPAYSLYLKTFDNIAKAGLAEHFRIFAGFVYYILSPGKGFFFYNPPLVLSLWGLGSAFKRQRRLMVYITSVILLHFIFYIYRFNRGSLFSWGPRYLYPTIPLLCVLLAFSIEELLLRKKRYVIIFLMLVGLFIQLPALFVNFSDYLFFVKEKLLLPEYLVNFIPDLSPILGTWRLFLSAFWRLLNGDSLSFIYNPDYVFFQPLIKSLANYDGWDIWWVHTLTVAPHLKWAVIGFLIFLFSIIVFSLKKIRWSIAEFR